MFVLTRTAVIVLSFLVLACDSQSVNTDGSRLVRLAGSNSVNRGRLEVFHEGVWGTVCDDVFDEMDARVACFSLGFGYIGFPLTFGLSETYGPGSGPIWLDELQCLGTETFIGDCAHNSWGSTNCQHREDVSIECSNRTRQVYSKKRRPLVLATQAAATATGGGGEGGGATTTPPTVTQQTPTTTLSTAVTATTITIAPLTTATTTTATTTFTTTAEPENTTSAPLTTETVTTGTGTTAVTTTHPHLHGPYMEMSLEGGMEARGGPMTMSCLHRYSRQFRELLDSELEHIKHDVLSSTDTAGNSDVISLCGGGSDVMLSQAFVNMLALGNNVVLDYGVYVTSNSSATLTVIEDCSWQLGSFLSNFNNWRQPIWLDIYQCPRLVFTTSQFNVTEVTWQCPTQQ